jgi:hypothetical protein
MIDIKELRIGNYVQNQDGTFKGIPIGKPVKLELKHFDIWLSMYVPIPLTKEWLSKVSEIVLQPYGYVFNDILIRFTFSPFEKYWIELGNGKRIELPYVHTLQNFFILTGKELTINETR